jgi:hypothetical protein
MFNRSLFLSFALLFVCAGTKAQQDFFQYKCFTLNKEANFSAAKQCAEKEENVITDETYYRPGEEIRLKNDNNTVLTLYFVGDTNILSQLSVEDIEVMNDVEQFQQMVLSQMGTPTMGYELMKNYDGPDSNIWTDYSAYEFFYRFVKGGWIYEFKIEQVGIESKNKKLVYPYSFTASVNKKPETETPQNGNAPTVGIYPEEGIQQFGEFTVESKLLRKW